MKITIISLDNWGFNKYIAEALKTKGHKVTNIDFNKFKYKYPSFFHRIYNFFSKAIAGKNLKTKFHGKKIIEKLQELDETQDIIITIKADHIDPSCLREFRKYTHRSVALFNDNTQRCPKIKRVIPLFDNVFSFEREDCEKYHLNFVTNWIYNYDPDAKTGTDFKYQVFNITSKDRRHAIIVNIAKELKRKAITYKIIIYDKKNTGRDKRLQYIDSRLSLDEVNDHISNSQALLDINRKGQKGLSFRVFESLGLQKKLITTNADIKNYDFYNPNNILVIDEANPVIPVDFFQTSYERVSHEVLQKYVVDNLAAILITTS